MEITGSSGLDDEETGKDGTERRLLCLTEGEIFALGLCWLGNLLAERLSLALIAALYFALILSSSSIIIV